VQRPATIVFVVVTAIACMALVYFQRAGWLQFAAFAKVFASSGFLLTAISAGALSGLAGRIVFTGLVLSMVGDMALIGSSRGHFLVGLSAFLLAHVAYITAFVSYGQDRRWALSSAVPVVISAVAVLLWLMPFAGNGLEMPVRIYTAVISLMVITAFGARGAGASSLIVAGAVMFFVSDLSVASLRVIETDFPTYIWGLPLYYAGQVCIALGASQSSSQ
jgi:uncharacterized membrane protein YhhN